MLLLSSACGLSLVRPLYPALLWLSRADKPAFHASSQALHSVVWLAERSAGCDLVRRWLLCISHQFVPLSFTPADPATPRAEAKVHQPLRWVTVSLRNALHWPLQRRVVTGKAGEPSPGFPAGQLRVSASSGTLHVLACGFCTSSLRSQVCLVLLCLPGLVPYALRTELTRLLPVDAKAHQQVVFTRCAV